MLADDFRALTKHSYMVQAIRNTDRAYALVVVTKITDDEHVMAVLSAIHFDQHGGYTPASVADLRTEIQDELKTKRARLGVPRKTRST